MKLHYYCCYKNKHDEIENVDIEEAVKKVTVGLEKHSRVYSEKDKKLTAYHEAGHAVVSKYLPTQTDVKRSIDYTKGSWWIYNV